MTINCYHNLLYYLLLWGFQTNNPSTRTSPVQCLVNIFLFNHINPQVSSISIYLAIICALDLGRVTSSYALRIKAQGTRKLVIPHMRVRQNGVAFSKAPPALPPPNPRGNKPLGHFAEFLDFTEFFYGVTSKNLAKSKTS